MAVEIIRLWGTADQFDIEFKKNNYTGRWDTTIPADLEDGHYVVELYAMNKFGEVGYWTGVLFMLQGRPHIHIQPPRYVIWSKPESSISLLPEIWSVSTKVESDISLMPSAWSISTVKRCNYGNRA